MRAGSERLYEAGLTKNISSCGVLFSIQRELDVGGPIEYIITLSDENSNPVSLRCVGKVVRHDNGSSDIAATVERYEFVRSRTR
jgi:hypothetical protein